MKDKSRRIGLALFRVRGSDERLRLMLVIPNPEKKHKLSAQSPGQDEFYLCHITKSQWSGALKLPSLVFLAWVDFELNNRAPVKNAEFRPLGT